MNSENGLHTSRFCHVEVDVVGACRGETNCEFPRVYPDLTGPGGGAFSGKGVMKDLEFSTIRGIAG